MRRFFGILSMILLSHLSLGLGDLACASHAGGMTESADSQQMDAAMGMDMHMDMGRQPAADASAAPCSDSQKQCSKPVMPTCCNAMATCGPLFVARADDRPFKAFDGTLVPLSDLLTSADGSSRPETPPPRA